MCSSDRSEEHTSELQSHSHLYAVFCLDRKSIEIGRAHVCSSHTLISYAVFCLKKKKAIAGAHGKTTTTSMLAHRLRRCGLVPAYLIGCFFFLNDPAADWGAALSLVVEGDE